MRFRVVSRGRASRSAVPERPQKPENTPVPPKAADLDNPYGRVFGQARKREDLLK